MPLEQTATVPTDLTLVGRAVFFCTTRNVPFCEIGRFTMFFHNTIANAKKYVAKNNQLKIAGSDGLRKRRLGGA